MDALTQARDRLFNELSYDLAEPGVLNADPWTINSLLQKSIRRGEVEVAQNAALTFLSQRGTAIWRRLMIVAFEDVGAASPDAVTTVVAASADSSWRKRAGGDALIAVHLARLLVQAPKSRSAEHLITASNQHPSCKPERKEVSIGSIADNLATVADRSASLTRRALAACCVSGVGPIREKSQGSDFPGLLETFRAVGVPDDLVSATGIATSKVRDPITVMVPLLWLAAKDDPAPQIISPDLPRTLVVGGVPLYSLDKHTRIGREAIRNLVKYNHEIRECLSRYVAPAQRNYAAYMAAFYTDAAPLARKFIWKGADELEAAGIETDLLKVGVSRDGIAPLLQVFRENVDHLNKIRAHTFCKQREFFDVATVLMTDGEGRA